MTDLLCRYYGRLGPNVGFFTVSIDGSRPQRFLNGTNSVELDQRMLWSNTSLGPGSHTITLTQDDVTDQALFLDFFRSVVSQVQRLGCK